MQQAGESVEKVKGTASEALRSGTEAAAATIKNQASGIISSEKGRLAGYVSHVSSAMHDAADRLRDEQNASAADYVDSLAEKLDGFSLSIDEYDAAALWSKAQDLAQRRPEIFYGGLLIAGIAAARFLKSAGGASRSMNSRSDFSGSGAWGGDNPAAAPESGAQPRGAGI